MNVRNRLFIPLLAGTLLLGAGCTPAEKQNNQPVPNTPGTSASNDVVDLSSPSIKMTNLTLRKDDTFTIERIIALEDGWVAIVNELNAKPVEVIGYAPVKKGLNSNVKVKISRYDATAQEYVYLLRDAGTIGEFDGNLEDEEYATDEAGKPVVFKFLAEVEE